jgi:lipoprotein-anchoring transpeptidase ErfK/SrfK
MSRGKHRNRPRIAGRVAGRLSILLGLASVVVVLAAGAAYAGYRYDRARTATFLPGIRIAGVDVSGLTRAQAEDRLRPLVQGLLDSPVDIQVGGQRWVRTTGSLGTTVDVAGALDRATSVSSSMSWVQRLYHRLLNRPLERNVDLRVSYERGPVKVLVEQIAAQVAADPVDAQLDFRAGRLVVQRSRPGRTLASGQATRDLLDAVKAHQASIDLPVKAVAPKVTEDDLGMTIIVRVSQNRLYLYRGVKLVKTYPVATGQLGIYPTPLGHFEIVNKRINPTWVNPAVTTWGKDEPAFIPPGPDNPLGTRAMDLSAPGIRIHGTPDDASIGHWASHGCIRMHIPDAEDLFNRVEVGTPVIIAF